MSNEVFQKKLDRAYEGIPNVIGIADDIIVPGSTSKEHNQALVSMLEASCKNNIGLNEREMNIPAIVRNPEKVIIQTFYEPKATLLREYGLMAPSSLKEGDSSPFYNQVYNPTQQEVKIRAITRMGTVREVGEVACAYKHGRLE